MRYVIVSSSTRVSTPIQKAIDAVVPWLPAHVSLSVEPVPLSTYLRNTSAGTTAIVSPANSLSYMGGGFDRAVLDMLTGEHTHYKTLEAAIQRKALLRHHGYIVPGTIHKIDLAHAYKTANIDFRTTVAYRHRITTLIQVPTMVVPEQISKQTVFDCMWNVLVECGGVADTVVLPALGTGYGGVDPDTVGRVMAGAVGLFHMNMAPLARSAAILLFTGKDYRRFGLESDVAELEKYLTEEGRQIGQGTSIETINNGTKGGDRPKNDFGENDSADEVDGDREWPMPWADLMRCVVRE